MRSLAQVLSDAQKRGVAVGHFNVSDLTLLQAAAAAARSINRVESASRNLLAEDVKAVGGP